VLLDPNVLAIDHAEVIVDPAMTEQNCLIGLFVAAQQIHCVRNTNGEIIEVSCGRDVVSFRWLSHVTIRFGC